MKRRLISLLTTLTLLVATLPTAALAAENMEVRWLLPEDTLVQQMTDEELQVGGIVPEEGTMGFQRDPNGITGARNVLVAPIRFAGEAEFLSDRPADYGGRTVGELIDLTYTGADISVDAYYDSVSFGAVDIVPILLLEDGGSLQLVHERSYYMPRSLENEAGYWEHLRAVRIYTSHGQATNLAAYLPELSCTETSPDGGAHVLLDEETGELLALCSHMDVRAEQRTDGRLELVWDGALGDSHLWEDSACYYTSEYEERSLSFQSEVYAAVNAAAYSQGIGDIDCITLWFSGNIDNWNSILWPHQSTFSAWGPTCYRDGVEKRYIALFTEYSFQTQVLAHLPDGQAAVIPENGTLAHELAHMLGFPDYYSYYDQSSLNLGAWSLMDNQGAVPQNIHGWATYIYGGWLGEDNVQQISTEGYYTITTISGADREERDGGTVYLYYIDNPAGDPSYPEQIVLEYRSPRGVFEQAAFDGGYMSVPGLILYSVDDEAERLLGGNTSATGLDGRYGAKLYYTSGLGSTLISDYSSLSSSYQQFYDLIAAPLSNITRRLTGGGAFLPRASYGSADLEETENALVSRRTGNNSGIVICSASVDPENPLQLTFWVDLDAPQVTDSQDNRRLGTRTVTLTFDEPVTAGPGFSQISASSGAVSASVSDHTLTITLTDADEGGQLSIPADAVLDQAERPMENAYSLTLEPADQHAAFVDVPADHWAYDAVTAVADAALFQGVGADRFAPDTPLTRATFVTVLGRLSGASLSSGETGFSDVSPDDWYAPYVKWATDNGIVSGVGGGAFAPDRPITREQMAVILARYLAWMGYEAPVAELQSFSDASDISGWAIDAVAIVQAAGLMDSGESGRFYPSESATRAQAAQVIWRCMTLVSAEGPQ